MYNLKTLHICIQHTKEFKTGGLLKYYECNLDQAALEPLLELHNLLLFIAEGEFVRYLRRNTSFLYFFNMQC